MTHQPTNAQDDEGIMIEKYIAQIEAHEMAIRLAEAATRTTRPAGLTAEVAMQKIREADPEAAASFYRMALAAAQYMEEAINSYQRVQ